MPADTSKVRKALLKKGFEVVNTHHQYFTYRCLKTKKLTDITTKISNGSHKEISDNLLSKMAKQMHISREHLNSFVDCNLCQSGYQDLIPSEYLKS